MNVLVQGKYYSSSFTCNWQRALTVVEFQKLTKREGNSGEEDLALGVAGSCEGGKGSDSFAVVLCRRLRGKGADEVG